MKNCYSTSLLVAQCGTKLCFQSDCRMGSFAQPDGVPLWVSMTMKAAASVPQDHGNPLPIDFRPGKLDCICIRGRQSAKHGGNVRLKQIVQQNLQRYSDATTKGEKSEVITQCIDQFREKGEFVKRIGERWYRSPENLAREKVGQLMRNLLHQKYRSSHTNKKAMRQINESQFE